MVADLRGLLRILGLEGGVVAELGGGLGGDTGLVLCSAKGLAKAGPPRESLLKRLEARSACASLAAYEEGGWVNLVAMVALALLA